MTNNEKSIKILSVPFAAMLVLAGCGGENDEVKNPPVQENENQAKQILKQERIIMKRCLSLSRIFN
ncbi:hypothetical protein ACV242_002610 [Peribacillus simplex]